MGKKEEQEMHRDERIEQTGQLTLTACAPFGLAQRGAAPLDSRPSPGGRDAGDKPSLLPCLEGVGLHLHQG